MIRFSVGPEVDSVAIRCNAGFCCNKCKFLLLPLIVGVLCLVSILRCSS